MRSSPAGEPGTLAAPLFDTLAYQVALVTTNFSVNDPHRMRHRCGLIEGLFRLVLVPLSCPQVSIIATRCEHQVGFPGYGSMRTHPDEQVDFTCIGHDLTVPRSLACIK